MRKMNKWFLLALAILAAISLSGCLVAWDPVFRYEGEHKDLAVTAIYSMPGVESSSEDQILVLEQDAFGRKLFAACLTRTWMIRNSFENCVLAILIMQKSDDSHAYFYGERNYAVTVVGVRADLTPQLVERLFSDDIISELKSSNDWDKKPSDKTNELVKVPLSLEKENRLSSFSKEIIEQKIGSNIRHIFFRQDNSGNEMYFVLHLYGKPINYEWYVIMFNQKGNLTNGNDSILNLDNGNLKELPLILAEFMGNNNWNSS